MLSREELQNILFNTVANNAKHIDYKRTVSVAHWNYKIMTGDDQDDIIVSYKRREITEQQHQRIRLTNSRTQYVGNKVFNLYSEVHRSDRTVNNIRNDSNDVDSLVFNLNNFNELRDLETYLDEKYRYFNFYDPNAFLVIEFDNEDPVNEKPTVYPFEVKSDEAVDYTYDRGVLQYLTVRQDVEYKSVKKDETVHAYKWTMYAPLVSYVAQHIPEDAVFEIPEGWDILTIQMKDVETLETMSDRVPAMQFGYLRDPITAGRTYVSPMYPAEKILTDLIWRKSEYDLAHALHGM